MPKLLPKSLLPLTFLPMVVCQEPAAVIEAACIEAAVIEAAVIESRARLKNLTDSKWTIYPFEQEPFLFKKNGAWTGFLHDLWTEIAADAYMDWSYVEPSSNVTTRDEVFKEVTVNEAAHMDLAALSLSSARALNSTYLVFRR